MLKTLIGLVAVAATGLGVYASGGGLLAYSFGLATVRVRGEATGLRIVAADAGVMHATGYVLSALVPMLAARGADAS